MLAARGKNGTRLTDRARLLLYVLCVCVRALTKHQAMRLLGFTDEANIRRFVRDLVARGLGVSNHRHGKAGAGD